jgi:aminobenzoyl-glutamate transport protein
MSSPASEPRLHTRLFNRWLDFIERAGNRLPDPLFLFFLMAVLVPVASWIAASVHWTLPHPVSGEIIEPVNLLTRDNLQRMFTEAVENFTSFPPLGVVLVAMIGIGVAERSGLIATLLKWFVTAVPGGILTAALVLAGVMSNVAADAGYVVLTPLGAVLFASVGRHPVAGLCAAFAGVSGGFSANLVINALDPLLAGFTDAAAKLYDPNYQVVATANYYFMVASTFLIVAAGWWVTEKIVEPRLGPWKPDQDLEPSDTESASLSERERTAALAAIGAGLLTLVACALLSFPNGALLRDEAGGLAPFYESLIPLIAIVFVIPGLVYGLILGNIRTTGDVARMMGDTMATMGGYIVLAFMAAQFVTYFRWSNLGLMFALAGADFLKGIGVGAIPLLLGIIVLSSVINFFIGSASAKWALMAPVVVPMLMSLGFSPEMAQAAYRIGDSITNIITPLLPYFPIILAFARKYDRNIRLGTLISSMLPYSIAFGVVWSLQLIVWYLLDLPLGPGAPIHLP